MTRPDYQTEQKYCDHCKTYVRYMMSVHRSFCVECGNEVKLFSRKDLDRFSEDVKRHRWQAS